MCSVKCKMSLVYARYFCRAHISNFRHVRPTPIQLTPVGHRCHPKTIVDHPGSKIIQFRIRGDKSRNETAIRRHRHHEGMTRSFLCPRSDDLFTESRIAAATSCCQQTQNENRRPMQDYHSTPHQSIFGNGGFHGTGMALETFLMIASLITDCDSASQVRIIRCHSASGRTLAKQFVVIFM
jgi:hypothetical protein